MPELERGDIVTKQPKKWYDGTPVKGWPDPKYMGRVIRVEIDSKFGHTLARIKWATGRLEYEYFHNLIKVKNVPDRDLFGFKRLII